MYNRQLRTVRYIAQLLNKLERALGGFKPPPSRHREFCQKTYFVSKVLLSDCQIWWTTAKLLQVEDFQYSSFDVELWTSPLKR